MGRGDKKTKKGKRTVASYGVSRPRAKAKAKALLAPNAKKAEKIKKVAVETEPKMEKVKVEKPKTEKVAAKKAPAKKKED